MSDQQIQCSDCGGAFVFTDSERAFYESKGLAAPPKRCPACRKARKLANPDRRPGGTNGGGAGWGRNPAGGPRFGVGDGGGARGGVGASPEARRWDKPSLRSDRASGGAQVGARGGGSRVAESRDRSRHGKIADRSVGAPPKDIAPPPARPTRRKFDITCATCQTPAQVPFEPLAGREVFCQACYRARRGLVATKVDVRTATAEGVGPAPVLAVDEGEPTID